MVVKIVHDELVAMLGSDAEPIDLAAAPPVAVGRSARWRYDSWPADLLAADRARLEAAAAERKALLAAALPTAEEPG